MMYTPFRMHSDVLVNSFENQEENEGDRWDISWQNAKPISYRRLFLVPLQFRWQRSRSVPVTTFTVGTLNTCCTAQQIVKQYFNMSNSINYKLYSSVTLERRRGSSLWPTLWSWSSWSWTSALSGSSNTRGWDTCMSPVSLLSTVRFGKLNWN